MLFNVCDFRTRVCVRPWSVWNWPNWWRSSCTSWITDRSSASSTCLRQTSRAPSCLYRAVTRFHRITNMETLWAQDWVPAARLKWFFWTSVAIMLQLPFLLFYSVTETSFICDRMLVVVWSVALRLENSVMWHLGAAGPWFIVIQWSVNSLCVSQAFVLAEAYDYSPDWAEILYQKVILNGEFNYLEEFKRHRSLSAGLFEDISKK